MSLLLGRPVAYNYGLYEGSVCAMLCITAGLLSEALPFIVKLNERIRIQNQKVENSRLVQSITVKR